MKKYTALIYLSLSLHACGGGSSNSTADNDSDTGNTPTDSTGTTYFILKDGGTMEQCDGLHNEKYDGQSNQCAWNHPWLALPPKGSANISPFKGGDTLIIGAGEYAIGFGAIPSSGTADCESASYPYACLSSSVPSGTSDNPTRILGNDYNSGCQSPPQLWGTYRTEHVINLQNSNHVVLECLDITDHAQCSRFHPSFRCDDDIGVVEGYAYNGIYATDSKDVLIKNVLIHGLDTGIHAGRLENWTMDNVVIRANKHAGWDGDIGVNSSNTGDIHFKNGRIEWSGCIEPYPLTQSQPIGCVSQDRGGYGDGLGTGATAGRWIFESFDFLHNVSDGLDLLYLTSPGQVIIKGGRYAGNAGNAIKTAGGGHLIENTEVIGNCGFFNQGDLWPDMVNHCRAQGNAMSLGGALDLPAPNPSTASELSNVSIWTEGDCAIVFESMLNIKDSIFYGAKDFLQPDEHSCFSYNEDQNAALNVSNTVIYGFKTNNSGCEFGINPAGNIGNCSTDPVFISGNELGSHENAMQSYDLRLLDQSPFKMHTPPLGIK